MIVVLIMVAIVIVFGILPGSSVQGFSAKLLMLAMIQYGPGSALIVAGGCVAINVVVGNVIEPRATGQGLSLSTLIVFLSLVFWGWVLGAMSMLLSVPLTMTIKIALESHPCSRWLAERLFPFKAGPKARLAVV